MGFPMVGAKRRHGGPHTLRTRGASRRRSGGSRHIAGAGGGGTALHMSRHTFQEPSACFLKTINQLPAISVGSPSSFGVIVSSKEARMTARSPATITSSARALSAMVFSRKRPSATGRNPSRPTMGGASGGK